MRFTIILAASAVLTGLALGQEPAPEPGDALIIDSTAVAAKDTVVKPQAPAVPNAPAALAQLKGFWMVHGSGGFQYSRRKHTDNHFDYWSGQYVAVTHTYTYTITQIDGGAGYFVTDGLFIGGTLSMIKESLKSTTTGGGTYYDYSDNHTASLTSIGPQVAWYGGHRGSKCLPFVKAEYDIVSSSPSGLSNNMLKLGGGLLFQLVPKIGLSLGVDYVKIEERKDEVNILALAGIKAMLY